MNKTENLRAFLQCLITPQSKEEQAKFMEQGMIDEHLDLRTRIYGMKEKELIKEINVQLAPFNLEVNEKI